MLKNQTANINQQRLVIAKLRPHPHEEPIQIDFRPQQKHLTAQPLPPLQFESSLPHFNHDGLYFTPAFILPLDQKFYTENINFEKLKFQERIQNAQEKIIIEDHHHVVPPSSYCQLCRLTYTDYLQHTSSEPHLLLAAKSPANRLIRELALRFSSPPIKSKKIAKHQPKQRCANTPKKQVSGRQDCNQHKLIKPLATFSKTTSLSTNMPSQII